MGGLYSSGLHKRVWQVARSKAGKREAIPGRHWGQRLMSQFITSALNVCTGTKVLKLVKFWLISVAAKLPKRLHFMQADVLKCWRSVAFCILCYIQQGFSSRPSGATIISEVCGLFQLFTSTKRFL